MASGLWMLRMNFKKIIKTRIIFFAQVAMLCGIFLCLACGHHSQKIKSFFIADYKVCLKILEKGNEAFQKGDFNKAREIYEILYRNSRDETIAREALYGLACTHFILAENSDDFNKAIVFWNKWSNLAPSVLEDEDPRMLGPLLQNKVKKWITDAGAVEILKSEANKVKLLLQSKEQEIRTLKHQIKTLEEIDQRIQEKKQEISSSIE
jgi:hypothetical protein